MKPDAALLYTRDVYPKLKLPGWVEGPFVIIRPGFFSDVYGEELEEVLKALAKDRKGKFVNYREGCLGPTYLRQTGQTQDALRTVMEQQPGSDILVVPGQFGIRHRGRSVRRARVVFEAPEYGTGAKDGNTMLLTHPIRLQHLDDLWLDWPGDEYSDGGDGQFDLAPYSYFDDDVVGFDANDVEDAYGYYGSVSFVLPQMES